MDTKLTLTIEQTVIEKAKEYASKEKRSLSDIVESYLKVITREDNRYQEPELGQTPTVKSMLGAFKMPKDFNYQDELAKGLAEKYLR